MRKAFSLIEMLVATVLITLLIGVALFAFRLQLLTLAKTNKEQLKEVMHYTHLQQVIESMKFYVVQEYDMLNQPIESFHYYFRGTEKSMNFITTNPIYNDADSVVSLTCKADTLLYTEEPLYGRIDFLRPELLEDSTKSVFYNDLEDCRFKYIKQDGEQTIKLTGKIPKQVIITLANNQSQRSFILNIQSDNNKTLYKVSQAVYDEF